MREPETWIWALLAIIALLVGLAWILKANTSNRPVDFMISVIADLTTYFKLEVTVKYRVPHTDEQEQPLTIEGQATPSPLDSPDGESAELISAEGGDDP
ncbi:hypothetical protein OWR29_45290 [Actinoplanes sp. Pm04-4]|uniref:Secreted protein n=1 Tax=Paractinoplanes pyxinae TaxID=2997416 RepID=A0ABT4BFN3_9ACTN|nr:hypothetical protein [Actinoplanes pyxinae]MCY1145261.1 hypothetical protein [Actinoplanes pyxinae]